MLSPSFYHQFVRVICGSGDEFQLTFPYDKLNSAMKSNGAAKKDEKAPAAAGRSKSADSKWKVMNRGIGNVMSKSLPSFNKVKITETIIYLKLLQIRRKR